MACVREAGAGAEAEAEAAEGGRRKSAGAQERRSVGASEPQANLPAVVEEGLHTLILQPVDTPRQLGQMHRLLHHLLYV